MKTRINEDIIYEFLCKQCGFREKTWAIEITFFGTLTRISSLQSCPKCKSKEFEVKLIEELV